MEAARADGEGKQSSSFRCADAARYAVASVVTILIVAVVVKAVMVLRPKPLYLSVPGGSAFFMRTPGQQRDEMLFYFSLRAQNPSDRVQMYYTNITGYFFNKTMSPSSSSSSNPFDDSMFACDLGDMFLPQQAEQHTSVFLPLRQRGQTVESFDFVVLYEGTSSDIVTDLTLRLDGTLITQPTPGVSNTTGRETSFYCRPLFAGGNLGVGASLNKQDAFCVSGDTPKGAKA